jgi:N6-adenosine-specific RNA methylase IME4
MTALRRYDAAERALAEAVRVDDVKDIRDKAVAMQAYAKQAKDTRLIVRATTLRMRAERRAGELLREMEKNKGARQQGIGRRGKNVVAPNDRVPKLADIGVSKTQSSRWQKLAALDADKFESHVERAGANAYDRMTRRFVKEADIEEAQRRHRAVTEHGCTVDDLVALAASGKRFPVVYADPPWPFETRGRLARGAVTDHDGTVPIDQIKALPIASLAADDAVLLLWCTWPHIVLGTHVEVIRAWGFKPSTCAFVWIKQKPDGDGLHTGMGYWTRSNSEVCLLATRGSPTRLAADVHQVVLAPVGEHSAKPEEVRRRIERLLEGPYLELYGRKKVAGWSCWGNEIPQPSVTGRRRHPAQHERSNSP